MLMDRYVIFKYYLYVEGKWIKLGGYNTLERSKMKINRDI